MLDDFFRLASYRMKGYKHTSLLQATPFIATIYRKILPGQLFIQSYIARQLIYISLYLFIMCHTFVIYPISIMYSRFVLFPMFVLYFMHVFCEGFPHELVVFP